MKARIPKQSMGNKQQMMKQLSDMQEKMNKVQEEVEEREFEATSGGGVVKVKFNGKKQMISLDIKEEVIDAEEKEELEDLIIAAVNSCIKEVEETLDRELSGVTGGLNIPGIL